MHLSEKEKEVAILIAQGMKDVEIAQKLYISRRRVGEIVFRIKDKWGIFSRVEIGIMAYHYGWIFPPESAAEVEMAGMNRRLTHV
ncbi:MULTISPECIES: response regulator transcription factor [unclassified Paenibacillus]|uniref:response regulator transcription factor n=1 Tax=unclassified Paenibacillus TaxID=185978 RepID=UPI000A8B3277|nr:MULTISPECIES: LuxR C-terminal-related transcriptional regulator [unclassified Paenibacillus]